MIRRLTLLLLAGVAVAAPRWSHAGEGEDDLRDEDGALRRLPEMGFPERRFMALDVGLATLVTRGPEELRVLAGPRVLYSPYIDFHAQSFEWTLLAGGYYGSWATPFNRGFTYELGGGVSFPLSDGWWRLPLILRSSFIHSPSSYRLGARFEGGVGWEVLRMVTVEVTGNGLLGTFKRDLADPDPVHAAWGIGASLSFDLCALDGMSWCNHEPKRVTVDDKTCQLYDLANSLARRPNKGNLCRAVHAALNTYDNPQRGEEPITTFLRGALEDADGEAAVILNRLRLRHEWLRTWLDEGRVARRQAAIGGFTLAVERQYAPYPVELEAALGCQEGKPTDIEPMPCD